MGLLLVGAGLGATCGLAIAVLTQYLAYRLGCYTRPLFAYPQPGAVSPATSPHTALAEKEQAAWQVKKPTGLSLSMRTGGIVLCASVSTLLIIGVLLVMHAPLADATAFWYTPRVWGSLLLTCCLLTLSVMDIEYRILPDWIVFPCLWAGVLLNVYQVLVPIWQSVWGVILAYSLLWGVGAVFQYCKGHPGVGQGDMKLIAMLCAWLGVLALPHLLLLAGVLSLLGTLLTRYNATDMAAHQHYPIPFGLYLSLAGYALLLYHLTVAVA